MTIALLVLAVVLIAGNGFFVGAEFAVLAARASRLEPLALTSRRARTAVRATRDLPLMISGCQFGITLCSLGLGALGEPAVARLLTGPLAAAGLPHGALHPVALTVALTVVASLHMLLGEMVPKNLALAGPERAAVLLAPPLVGFVRVFRPLLVMLTATATGVLRLMRIAAVTEVGDAPNREAVASLILASREEGLLGGDQHQLLTGALTFDEATARSVLLPREALITVDPGATPAQLEELVAHTGFSRFPVAGPGQEAGQDPPLLGYVHVADVLEDDPDVRNTPLDGRWVRPLASVTTFDRLHVVLATLQRTGAHLGRVVDEAGITVGVIALEDVLEELVGEVRDATRRPPTT